MAAGCDACGSTPTFVCGSDVKGTTVFRLWDKRPAHGAGSPLRKALRPRHPSAADRQGCRTIGENRQFASAKKADAEIEEIKICPGVRLHPSAIGDVLKTIPDQPRASAAFLEADTEARLIHEVKGRRADGHGRGCKEQAPADFSVYSSRRRPAPESSI